MSETPMIRMDFDRPEYDARIAHAQRLMTERGLDALLFATEGNVRYYTGYTSHRWWQNTAPQFGVLPQSGLPSLLVSGVEIIRAASHPWMKDIRTFGGLGGLLGMPELAQMLRDLGLETGRIGAETGSIFHMGLAIADFDALKASLPQARFEDASDLFWQVRIRKSPGEIERLRRACAITEAALQDLYRDARPGMTEKELHARMIGAVFAHGAERQGSIPVASRSPGTDFPPDRHLRLHTDRKVQAGDVVWLDAGSIYDGYWSDTLRMFCVGKAVPEWKRAYSFIHGAVQACIAEAVVGAPASNAMKRFQAELAKSEYAGFAPRIRKGSVAHCVGLDLIEPPYMHSDDQTPLEPGMVFTIEPFIYTPETGFFMIEEDVLVTETGPVVLSVPAPAELLEVG